MDNNNLGFSFLLVALIAGAICFYIGKDVGAKEGYQDGYDDGYSACDNEKGYALEYDAIFSQGYDAGFDMGYDRGFDAADGK